ncbi:MAG: MCE family protein [Desulfobacterales bacterium]|nr:MCE family protein [Desulfobacterales bacterium]
MNRFSVEAKVGFFVIIAILTLSYMSIKVGKSKINYDKGYEIFALFDSASGLSFEAPVEIAGVEIGRVSKISLENGRALISMIIDSSIQLNRDSEGFIRSKGILGDKYIEIVPGKTSAPLIQTGERISYTSPTTNMDSLMNTIGSISVDIKKMTGALSEFIAKEDGDAPLKSIINNLDEMLKTLNDAVQKNNDDITKIIGNIAGFSGRLKEIGDENSNNINLTVTNLKNASDQLKDILLSVNDITKKINEGQGTIGRLINDDETIIKLNDALVLLKEITEKINNGTGTIGKLINDDTIVANVTSATESLKDISAKINNGDGSIGKLVNDDETVDNINNALSGINEFIQKQNKFRTYLDYWGEYRFNGNEAKSYLNIKIQPKEDKFYILGLVSDPAGKETTKDTYTTIDGVSSVEHKIEIDKDEFKISAQIAKRYYDFCLRGGLFESTGGLGVDYYLFNDKLSLSLEAFDFDPDRRAHLKFKANFTPYNHIYLSSGFDNFISDDGKESFFLGGGLSFSEEDIKSLIFSIPLPKN